MATTKNRARNSVTSQSVDLGSGSNHGSPTTTIHSRPLGLVVGIWIGVFVFVFMDRLQRSMEDVVPGFLLSELTISTAAATTASAVDQTPLHVRKTTATRQRQNHHQNQKFSDDPSWDIYQRIEAEQTGRLVGPRTEPPTVVRPVHFLDSSQLSHEDADSASWLQRTVDFRTHTPFDAILTWQDAATKAIVGKQNDRFSKVRMPMDFLDFSVEHFSNWWKIVGVYQKDIPFNLVIETMEKYIENGMTYPLKQNDLIFNHTLAVIPLSVYAGEEHNPADKVFAMNTKTLAATIESIRRAGFGRVVVVGMDELEEKIAKESFRLIQGYQERRINLHSTTGKQQHILEMAFVRGKADDAGTPPPPSDGTTKWNTARAALLGLRRAFDIAEHLQGSNDNQVTPELKSYVETWLGSDSRESASYWQYIYLTEADSILNTRPSVFQPLKDQVDQGNILVPHRLLTIPSETDIHRSQQRDFFIHRRGDHWEATELDALDFHPDMCCDEYKGPDTKPGRPPNFPDCGDNKPWYTCEFYNSEKPEGEKEHERLKPYKLIRLMQGTGMALLASNEKGRRCTPGKNSNTFICEPPTN